MRGRVRGPARGPLTFAAIFFVAAVAGGCGGDRPDASRRGRKDPGDVVFGTPGQGTGRTGPAPGFGRITGIVESADGPVEGVLVEPTSLETPMLAHEELAIVTDADGRYVYAFREGRWRLTTSKRGYCPASTTAVAKDGRTSVADIYVRRKPCDR